MAEMAQQQQDYVALEWVKGEIEQTLKQTQQSLKAFADKPNEGTALRFCLAHVHQIKGSLQMVEAHALVQLAGDMEALILALEAGNTADTDEALQVLMQAVLQLPLYLEQLALKQGDLSVSVLPLRNQIRAAHGEAPLAESNLLSLKLPETRAELSPGELLERDSPQLGERLHRMRLALQIALPGIVRGQDVQRNLDYLSRVFSALEKLSQSAPSYPLWQAAAALAEGLKIGAIDTSPALHILLRKLDNELKLLIERGIEGINQAPPAELLSSLLLQVAHAQKNSPRINVLKAEYALDTLQSTPPDNATNPDALRAVVTALCEDLVWVKDELDLFVRSHNDNVEALGSLLLPLNQVEGALSVLGFSQAQKTIQTQINTLNALTSGRQSLSHGLLLDMAGALLYVESSLLGMVSHESIEGLPSLPEIIDLPHTQQRVMQESLLRLGQIKDAFIEFISNHWQREYLETVPELLTEVSGALQLASFERAGQILLACNRYVQEHLLSHGQVPPDWQSLDRLADALSAVEYYLERLRIDPPEQAHEVLLIAEQSLQTLGYPPLVDETLKPEPQTEADEADKTAEATTPASLAQASALELAAEPADKPLAAPPALSISEVLAEPVAPINPPADEVPLSILPPAEDEEPLDEELLEVFIEEMGEVQDSLHELLPRWQNAAHERALQSEVRRAFHTLKGSGRMVRALVIGELAWSVENLLNRVLDSSREVDSTVLALVSEVTALLPELGNEFAARAQRQRDDVDQLAIRAHALAKSQPLRATPAPQAEETEEALNLHSIEEQADEISVEPLEDGLNQALQESPSSFADDMAKNISAYRIDSAAESTLAESPIKEDAPAASEKEQPCLTTLDSSLLDIFHQEAQEHLDTLAEFLKDCVEQLPRQVTTKLQTAIHTLKGSAHVAGVLPIAQIAAQLEKLLDVLKSQKIPVDLIEASLLGRAGSLFRKGLAQLAQEPLAEIPGSNQLLRDIALWQEQQSVQAPDEDTNAASLLSEGMDTLQKAGQLLQQWRDSGELPADFRSLLASLEQLTQQANDLNLPPFSALCSTLLALYHDFATGQRPTSDAFFEQAQKTHELLLGMLDNVVSMMEVANQDEQIAALQALLAESDTALDALILENDENLPSSSAEIAPTEAAPISEQDPTDDLSESTAPELAQENTQEETPTLPWSWAEQTAPAETAHLAASSESNNDDELDKELLAIFLEEGQEIIAQAHQHLQQWIQQPASEDALAALQRYLHTLKGSARATGFWAIGHLAHALEFLYEDLAENKLKPSAELLELLQQGHDRLAVMLEALGQKQTVADSTDLVDAIALFRRTQEQVHTGTFDSNDEDSAQESTLESHSPEPIASVSTLENPLQNDTQDAAKTSLSLEKNQKPRSIEIEVETATTVAPPIPSSPPSEELLAKILPFTRRTLPSSQQPAAPQTQEQVRISAAKLDSFSNLAGEISIFRARIEQQVGDFGFTLAEMESTIERVRGQLRQLDIETQAQTISHYQAAEQRGEDFDPLEMDRHSQLQQLARGLFESATDLLDLKQALETSSRDAQTLLLQQARASTDLQESLMHTRLVRFERVVPRLARIVRQLSRELGKKVDLLIDNEQTELDRTLLEHLYAPLEHMLRNAIDHGLELPSERLLAGKPENGQIRLSLSRDSSEIVLRLEDDGRGIDLDKVRQKAIERGLTREDTQLSEQEIRQFVLEPGFSTATEVSQTSGRGIGMDVVQSEIRRAGGSLAIDSSQGQGTRFTIRLPFTVSVSRALMVRTGDDLYALALGTVEGVARLSADELARQYRQSAPSLNYGGQPYALHYLGDLLGNGQKPKLVVGHSLPLPVILLKSGEQHLAVQVDALAGAREIVVKGLGHPFGSVPGISGATILGDGNVVIILDLATLMRKRQRQLLSTQASLPELEDSERPLLIMVVDDSITVRKVTGRLLERHGMNVLTAKDGIEAMALLQEHQPDLMLLDIEMPRMDGFEVATLVRHSEQFKDLPIIMITSRTGTKHRERGFAIGVNDYLGKPYQDAQLLGRIEQLTQPQRTPQHA